MIYLEQDYDWKTHQKDLRESVGGGEPTPEQVAEVKARLELPESVEDDKELNPIDPQRRRV